MYGVLLWYWSEDWIKVYYFPLDVFSVRINARREVCRREASQFILSCILKNESYRGVKNLPVSVTFLCLIPFDTCLIKSFLTAVNKKDYMYLTKTWMPLICQPHTSHSDNNAVLNQYLVFILMKLDSLTISSLYNHHD